MKQYQIFFNKRIGYRKDYEGSLWSYINHYLKNIIDIGYYSDAVKKDTVVRVEVKGVRGGRTGNYTNVVKKKSKPTYEKIRISFLRWTWFGISLEFSYSRYVYFKCGVELTIHKPKLTFDFNFSKI